TRSQPPPERFAVIGVLLDVLLRIDTRPGVLPGVVLLVQQLDRHLAAGQFGELDDVLMDSFLEPLAPAVFQVDLDQLDQQHPPHPPSAGRYSAMSGTSPL